MISRLQFDENHRANIAHSNLYFIDIHAIFSIYEQVLTCKKIYYVFMVSSECPHDVLKSRNSMFAL